MSDIDDCDVVVEVPSSVVVEAVDELLPRRP